MAVNASHRQRDLFEQAKSNIEIVANSMYYSIALSNHLMKLDDPTAQFVVTLDELLEIDFIIGNLVIADVIMQGAQKISA